VSSKTSDGDRIILMTDNLLKRFTLLKNMEYFIEESVYYRTHSEELDDTKKQILLHANKETGKIQAL